MRQPTPEDRFSARVRKRLPRLTPTLRRVALYMDANRMDVLTRSAAELGRATGTSDATVVRTAKALGFAGLPDLKRGLAEAMGPRRTASGNLQATISAAGAHAADMIEFVLSGELAHLSDFARDPTRRRALLDAIDRLGRADRVLVLGHGLAAAMASYFALQLNRFGLPAQLIDQRGFALIDQMLTMRRGDCALLLSIGESYPETDLFLGEARALGLPVVVLTDSPSFFGSADVLVALPRNPPGQISLHGIYFVCLQAMAVGLSAASGSVALAGLDRLARLRNELRHLEHERRRVSFPPPAPEI